MSLVDSFPSSIGDYLGPLRWGLLALNCGLILAFAGVMRRATEQMDTHIARVKKYGKEKAERSRNVLFVIAHPDDEAMFFVPTILSLNGYPGYRSHLLCLSSGNADGLGDTRTKELFNSCKILGIDTEKVQVVDDLKLQDGFEEVWEPAAVASAVSTSVDKWNINSIITFDNQGVSGHPNHIATWLGVKNMVDDKAFQDKHEDFRLWTLASTSFLRKYSGICDIFLSAWDPGAMFYSPKLWTNHAAMAAHYSQFVWYRRLFVFFSRYGYINNLVEHNSGKEDEEKRKKTQ